MPHCGRPLYNNLLWSNWQPHLLSHVIIIGNSFHDSFADVRGRCQLAGGNTGEFLFEARRNSADYHLEAQCKRISLAPGLFEDRDIRRHETKQVAFSTRWPWTLCFISFDRSCPGEAPYPSRTSCNLADDALGFHDLRGILDIQD